VRQRWFSRRALGLHFAVVLFVPACFIAEWWQVSRASDGNGLSYLYSVEWPIFAILGAYFWWMLIHTDYETVGLKGTRRMAATTDPPDSVAAPDLTDPAQPQVDDPELAAYNARLAALAGQGPKTWRAPEPIVVRRQASS
jgi:DNA-binding transcriptional regulator of glucitol operon